MKLLFIILAVSIPMAQVFGWGAPNILPAEQRTKEYKISTKYDKKKSFAKLSIWAAKTFSNSNESIKMKDADLGVMVVKGNLPCTALKIGSGYGENQRLEMAIEITVEDKTAEIKASDVVGKANGAYDDGTRPSTQEEMATAVKECIDPFVANIKKELN